MTSAGNIDQMKSLISCSQDELPEDVVQDLLLTAARSSHLDLVHSILHRYPSLPLNEEIVRGAVNTGSIPILKALLAHDSSIINMQFDRRGTPLIVACMGQQRFEYLQFLLESGADPNQDPDVASFPLALVAALYKDSSVIDLLLQNGARMERSGSLAAAARRGNEVMLRHLLRRGARPETDAVVVGTNDTPLNVAVKSGHLGIARILIQHGADACSTDADGITAIEASKQVKFNGEDVSEMSRALGEPD